MSCGSTLFPSRDGQNPEPVEKKKIPLVPAFSLAPTGRASTNNNCWGCIGVHGMPNHGRHLQRGYTAGSCDTYLRIYIYIHDMIYLYDRIIHLNLYQSNPPI